MRLYHDQGLFKEPGGGPTPWHQDGYYWPLDTDRTITLWMPLVDVPAEIGTMTFASGSHVLPDLRGPQISDASQDALRRARCASGACRSRPTGRSPRVTRPSTPGGWSTRRRRTRPTGCGPVMTVIYVDAEARVAAEITEGQVLDHKVWLGGLPPGSPLDDERNPVLWPA